MFLCLSVCVFVSACMFFCVLVRMLVQTRALAILYGTLGWLTVLMSRLATAGLKEPLLSSLWQPETLHTSQESTRHATCIGFKSIDAARPVTSMAPHAIS